MGTVKYTGPMASFHCPTNAEIRSLKVHFSPKQLGEGNPSPENVREIVGWDGVEAYDWTSANVSTLSIPSEYKKVEYLESTGTQYIYTNVPGRYGIECRAKVLWTSYGDTTIFGARKDSSDRIMLIHQYPNYKWTLGYGASYTNLSQIDFNVIYDVESKVCSGEQYLRINGTTVYTGTDSAEYSNDFNMSLFACTYGSSNYCKLKASARIYSLNAKLDGIEVLNVVPCLRKSDNKPGMYDTVSQTFYTNAGTGEFLYGPEVSGYTENYEFGVLGKNKLSDNIEDYSFLTPSQSSYNYTLNNGEFSATVPNGVRDYLAILGNKQYAPGTYTLSFDYINGGGNTSWQPVLAQYTSSWYSSKVAFYANQSEGHCERTFTSDVPFSINLCLNSFGNTTQEGLNKIYNLQIELGSTATAYEPYDPKHTVYGGWVDLISGEVCEEWGSKIINGSENWSTQAPHGNFARIFLCNPTNSTMIGNSTASKPNGMADIFDVVKQNGDESSGGRLCCRFGWGDKNFYILNVVENISEVTDVESLKQYLSEHNIHIVYNLQTQYYNTYHLAPTALQTFLGYNNVWSNADYVEVEYDLHETQDILNRKAFIMANQPHIVKPAAAPLQNFKTDVIAPLKECKIHFSPMQEGTGDPSPTNVRSISGWNKIQVGLPAEYQEVEYIGAENASPYIDTGIYLTDELQAEIHYYNDKKEAFLFGSRQSTSGPFCNFNIDVISPRCRFDYSNIKTSDTAGFQNGTHDGEYLFTFTNRVGTLRNLATDDVRTREDYKNANGTLFTTAPVLLFGVHTGSTKSLGTAAGALRIYSAKFWLGGTYANDVITGAELVRNFVPRIRKSDNVVGMYDTVTAAFYTSQNSDTFTAGPVVNSPSVLVDWTDTAGTVYGGYVDLVRGEIVQTWISRLGSEMNVQTSSSTDEPWVHRFTVRGLWLNSAIGYENGTGAFEWISDKIPHGNAKENVSGLSGSGILYVYDNTISTAQSFKEKYADTQFVYQLKPTAYRYYTIDPITLKTLRGTNNIWASNNGGNIELAYWSH